MTDTENTSRAAAGGEPPLPPINHPVDLSRVTRIEVIDADGRAFVGYYDRPGVTRLIQDDGRTLKIFTDGHKTSAVIGPEAMGLQWTTNQEETP